MVSRMKELEQLILKGRKPTSNIFTALQRKFAGKGNLTNTEKRKLKALQRQARKSVDIENQFRNVPTLDVTITKGKIPSAEALDRKNVKTAKPKKKPIRTKGSAGARDRASTPAVKKGSSAVGTTGMGTRAGIQTGRRPGTNKLPTGKGGTTTLMPKTYTIKAGDTLTSIAKKMNTTVAMLKKANNIKDANKIRAGAKIKIYRDKPNERAKITQSVGGRPRTIAQAQKMGKKYFYDKNGKRKAAVTAEQLKKSGLTLAQWLKKN